MQDDDTLGKAYDAKLYKRLFAYTKPYFKYVALALLLLLIATLSELVVPIVTKMMIDRFIKSEIPLMESMRISGLINFSMLFLGIILLFSIIRYGQVNLMFYVSQKVLFDLREELYNHLKKLSMNFFQKQPVGRLVTRITNDIEVLNEFFTAGVVGFLADIFVLVGIVIFMLLLNWKLALVSFVIIPLILLVSIVFRKVIRPVYREVRRIHAKINAYFAENLAGMKIVQMFNREEKHITEFDSQIDEFLKNNMRSVRVFSVFFPVIDSLSALALAIVLWYGGLQHFNDLITLGTLVAFNSYVQRFFRPIRDLSQKYNILQNSMASSERIFKLLDESDVILEQENSVEIKDVNGEIEFKNVSFYYKEDEWVLNDISFKINPGEKVALVGATGSGKTTIAMLIARFYDIQKGNIYLDGKDIKSLKKSTLRRNLAIVLQDVFLFSGTIRDNIKLWDESISEERIMQAASIANVDKFISKFKKGFDEMIMEGGANLSTGQKQLISFARALAYSPEILILDEATSNIDSETEYLIQDALEKLTKNRTSLIIAHRLSTIQNVDRIIVLHKGRIVEEGSHRELLKKKGVYWKLYQLQWNQQTIISQ
ncbi:MAG TPA: ABC transporter ATP-binding protein [Firmicutes bacterium]|nr:ABC transporter ATP-binding protein [Bacillota bacterium]